MKFSPKVGSSVDIHLPHGVMARGVVSAITEDVIVLEKKPAVHSCHGSKAYEKVTIDQSNILALGVNLSNGTMNI